MKDCFVIHFSQIFVVLICYEYNNRSINCQCMYYILVEVGYTLDFVEGFNGL